MKNEKIIIQMNENFFKWMSLTTALMHLQGMVIHCSCWKLVPYMSKMTELGQCRHLVTNSSWLIGVTWFVRTRAKNMIKQK